MSGVLRVLRHVGGPVSGMHVAWRGDAPGVPSIHVVKLAGGAHARYQDSGRMGVTAWGTVPGQLTAVHVFEYVDTVKDPDAPLPILAGQWCLFGGRL